MKINFLVSALIIAFFFSSCSIDKRLYRPGFHIEWRNQKVSTNEQSTTQISDIKIVKVNEDFLKYKEVGLQENKDYFTLELSEERLIEYKNEKLKKIKIADSCDLIVCKNGDEIDAKVLEIGLSEIKYKKCDNLNGPTISIKKADVLMVKYPNGTKDIIKSSGSGNTSTKSENDGPKLNPLALTSMILGILSLLTVISYFMIAMGIVAIILGVVANKQIKENPDNFTSSSSKMAKAGIICAIVGLGLLAILLIL